MSRKQYKSANAPLTNSDQKDLNAFLEDEEYFRKKRSTLGVGQPTSAKVTKSEATNPNIIGNTGKPTQTNIIGNTDLVRTAGMNDDTV